MIIAREVPDCIVSIERNTLSLVTEDSEICDLFQKMQKIEFFF